MKLSPHFSLIEFTRSSTAARRGIRNEPEPQALANLKRLASVLELVRERIFLGRSIHILSGYRSVALNHAVGGSEPPRRAWSYHIFGLAADFDPPPGMTHDELQHAIGADPEIPFDKCIEERTLDGAHWIHFQIAKEGAMPRRTLLDMELARQGGATTRVTAG